jgi:hypothetical protein
MFSTSMIASSTTSPRAMIKSGEHHRVHRDAALPQHQRRRHQRQRDGRRADQGRPPVDTETARITITSTQPMIIDQLRFSSDISMNVAGRKIVESTWMPVRPGFISSKAASTLRVTSSVLPVGCFSTISSNPGTSLMIASPMGGGWPSRRLRPRRPIGAVRRRERRPGLRARSSAVTMVDTCRTGRVAGSAYRRSRRPRPRPRHRQRAPRRRASARCARADVPDRPAPGTAGPARPRSPRWPRPERPSVAGGSSTWPTRSCPSASLSLPFSSRSDQMPIFKHATGRRQRREDHRRLGNGRQADGLDGKPLAHQLPRLHQIRAVLEDQH